MSDQPRFCQYCGTRLNPDWVFCENCGKPVPGGEPQIPPSWLAEPENTEPVAPQPAVPPPAAPPAAVMPPPPPPVQRVYQPVPPVQRAAPASPGKSGSKVWIIILIVALAACCCLTAILGFVFRDKWLPEDVMGMLATPTSPAAQPVAPIQPQAATQAPVQPGQSQVQYQDDFSSSNDLWNGFDDSDAYSGFSEGGVYAIAVRVPSMEIYAYPDVNAGRTLDDVTVNVSAYKVEGAGDWGIMCRYVDMNNFYRVAIDDGWFAIYKVINDEVTYLTNPEWIESNALDPNGYNNGQIPISLTCNGDQIHFETDGYLMYDVRDDSLPAGDIRIYAGSYDTVGDVEGNYIKVLFDNFSFTAP